MTNQRIGELINLISKSEISALEDLYKNFSKSVFFFALSYLKNTQSAEDIMQETFISIAKKAELFKLNTNASAWILQITKNLCLNKLRRSKLEERNLEQLYQIQMSNQDNTATIDDKINCTVLLKNLSIDQQNIIVQKVFYGLTFKELSKLTNKSERTLKRMYKAIIDKCKSVFDV